MRGAATATLATVAFGLIGCQEEVTAIRLIVSPDDAAGVRQATHLEVYVGHGAVQVPRAIQVHADDGQPGYNDVGAFDREVEIYLTDEGATGPFWVGVRAVIEGATTDAIVVGEGGHPTTLAFEPGVVLERRIDVHTTRDPNNTTRLPEVWAPCPGWTDEDSTRHHIVADVDGDDCDGDGYAYEQGTTDCDDFDPTFNPMAQDLVCDHVDHTCGRNVFIGQSDRCLGMTDPQACFLGTTPCVDNDAPPATCEGPGIPMPLEVCLACSTRVGAALNDCIKDAASVHVTCDLFHDAASFCGGESFQLGVQPSWWQNAGGAPVGRTARWLRLFTDAPLDYGWVNGVGSGTPTLTAQAATNETPPSPALFVETGLTAIGDSFQDTSLMVIGGGPGIPELYRVDVSIQLTGDCSTVAGEAGCTPWPGGM